MVLSALLTACHRPPQGNSSTRATTAAATSAHTPPDQPSEEAESPQIRMARDEGKAYQASLAYMVNKVAVGGGATQRSGDYIVAYAEEKAEGLYSLRDARLEWREPRAENAHLEVSVSDASDGRFIPYLKIQATLTAPMAAPSDRSTCRSSGIRGFTITAEHRGARRRHLCHPHPYRAARVSASR